MSEEKVTLALTFLRSHPDLAAATLEQHVYTSVAGFLAGIPHSYSAPVLSNMLPSFAARVSGSLSREKMLVIFARLKPSQIAAILRHMSLEKQQACLRSLPAKTQLICSLLLNYSKELVGAWVTAQVATISQDSSAGEALNLLKSEPDAVRTDFVYVVNREGELMGRIRLIHLLKAQRKRSVNGLTESCRHYFSGHRKIEQAALDEDWKKYNEIPVINRNHKFIGVLRHLDLRKALAELEAEGDSAVLPDSVIGLSAVYGESLLALCDSLQAIVKADLRS